MGVSSSNETHAFAEEIFRKVEHKNFESNPYRQQEEEAAMLARKQRTYKLLEADDDDDNDDRSGSVSVAPQSKKADKRVKRFRKKSENQEDEDDEGAGILQEQRRVKQKASREESDGSESEEERLHDQIEREELERHLREKDAAKTTKLTEQKLSKREEEEAIRRASALEQDDIGALRKVSRQEYLKKREQKKLEEIRYDIEDEQYLFEGVKLTEAEQRELRNKKQIYELVKKRSQEDDNINEYRMPDAYDIEGGVNQEKRFSVAMERYRVRSCWKPKMGQTIKGPTNIRDDPDRRKGDHLEQREELGLTTTPNKGSSRSRTPLPESSEAMQKVEAKQGFESSSMILKRSIFE